MYKTLLFVNNSKKAEAEKRYMKKSYIIFLFVIFTIFSFEIIYFARVIKSKERAGGQNTFVIDNNKTADKNVETKVVSSNGVKVSPSAKIEMVQYYDKCGHVVSNEYKAPASIVNMEESEVEKYYKGWEIEFFSKEYIKMYKKNKGMCPEHYTIKNVDGYISIFNRDENDKEVLYKATDIVTKYLSEKDRANLEEGLTVTGKEKLEAMLQDFE